MIEPRDVDHKPEPMKLDGSCSCACASGCSCATSDSKTELKAKARQVTTESITQQIEHGGG